MREPMFLVIMRVALVLLPVGTVTLFVGLAATSTLLILLGSIVMLLALTLQAAARIKHAAWKVQTNRRLLEMFEAMDPESKRQVSQHYLLKGKRYGEFI